MLKTENICINAPSDFKIRVDDIFDKDGVRLSPSVSSMSFVFLDTIGNRYVATCDNINKSYKNVKIENGKLYIIFENYNFADGELFCRIASLIKDNDFADYTWHWYEEFSETGITIKNE